MKKITLPFLIIIPFSLFSQSKLVPGFIIKPSDDTVKGYLKELSEKKVQDKISFSPSQGAPAIVNTTHDILGFGYEGGNTYNKVKYTHPVDLTTNERFAKKLVEGYNRLYMFWQKEKRYFIINTYEDSTYLLFDDNFSTSGIVSEYGNYKNQLLYLSVACDSLKGLIEYLEYRQYNLAKYVDRLNKCILPSEQNAIVYTKDKSYLNIYAYAGAMPIGKMYEYTGRITGRFTMPSIDKNMSVNVGINFMTHKKTETLPRTYSNSPKREQVDYKNIYTMPFTIQYNLMQGKVSPYIDAGLSFAYIDAATQITNLSKTHDRKFGIGVVVAAGIEGHITNRLMAKAEWRYELFLHYPTIGIGYFFK